MIEAQPIQLLFCHTEMALSKLIMWGLNEPASHLAIDLPSLDVVLHSDLLGLHQAWRGGFLRAHTIVQTFKVWLPPAVQTAVQNKLTSYMASLQGGSYDYGAFAYFAYRAGLAKLTGAPIPKTCPWGDKDSYLCTEGAYLLNEALVECTGHPLFDYDTELDAMSPWQLLTLLQKTHGGKNEVDFRTAT